MELLHRQAFFMKHFAAMPQNMKRILQCMKRHCVPWSKVWRLVFLTPPTILKRILSLKIQNFSVKWNSENRFTFVRKNPEWQIAIPRSPNEYIISKRKYKQLKKLSLYFLFPGSRSYIKSSCNKHFTEVPSVYKHNSIFLGFEDCRLMWSAVRSTALPGIVFRLPVTDWQCLSTFRRLCSFIQW